MAETEVSGFKALEALVEAQLKTLWQAHCRMQAVRVAIKAKGFYKSHKTIGHFSKNLQASVNDLQGLVLRYFKRPTSVPATTECPADCPDLHSAVTEVRDALMAAQKGWREISAKSEGLKVQDLDSYAEDAMEKLIDDIEDVNDALNLYDQIECDKSAWLNKRFGKLSLG